MLHIETSISKGRRTSIDWHVGEKFPPLTIGELACITVFQIDGDELEFFRSIDMFEVIPPDTTNIFRTTDKQTCVIAVGMLREYFHQKESHHAQG